MNEYPNTAGETPVLKRAILCAIHPQGGEQECMSSLRELERLLDTAGGENVGILTQMRETPDNKTMFGSGKIRELGDMCDALEADLVVFDCELSPSQIREIEDAIARERVLMAPVKASADLVFDTSKMSAAQFREHFLKVLNKEKDSSFFVNVTSFGFKYGSPKDADIVFDVRCFPNPYWVAELKELTGLDSAVSDYVMSFEEAKMFIQKLQDMIEFMIPLYIKEGKPSLTVAIGCTGGKHRSVTFACRLAKYINDNIVTCLLNHRDINK